MRPARLGLIVLALVGGVLARDANAQRSFEEAIYPLAEYKATDARVLAEAHASELRQLYEGVRRCVPEVDFHRQGLGFRRPIGATEGGPHLTLWVWTPTVEGRDLPARAADAFRRFSPRLWAEAAKRQPVHADGRVGGYGLVLSWLKPGGGDSPVGETLVLFAPKAAVAAFVEGRLSVADLRRQARIRLFDGQIEVPLPGGIPPEAGTGPITPPPAC